jgi:hypothetical protein
MKFSEWYELREQKDACYHKVKSRYRVWPSAYASGALVKCRKKGAKNWGNKKKKKKMTSESSQASNFFEALKDKKQYDDAAKAVMALHYKNIDAETASTQEIIDALNSMGKQAPEGTSLNLFVSRIRSVARGTVQPEDFKEGTFDLEKKEGLRGWFKRNGGKGWVDCKASKKGKIVPCGRKSTGKGAKRKYPACRPTLSACNKKGVRRKKSSKKISWE